MSTSTNVSTFITYTLTGVNASPIWTVPNYEQIICSCEGITRSVSVEGMTRCDSLPSTHIIIQKGPAGTLLVLDGGPEFCSYMLHSPTYGSQLGSITSAPGSLCVIPFSSCAVIGLNSYVCNESGGVMTVTWMKKSAYITITVYGTMGTQLDKNKHYCQQRQDDHQSRNEDAITASYYAQKENQHPPQPTSYNTDAVMLSDNSKTGKKGSGIDSVQDFAKDTASDQRTIDLLAEVIREAELDSVVECYTQPMAPSTEYNEEVRCSKEIVTPSSTDESDDSKYLRTDSMRLDEQELFCDIQSASEFVNEKMQDSNEFGYEHIALGDSLQSKEPSVQKDDIQEVHIGDAK